MYKIPQWKSLFLTGLSLALLSFLLMYPKEALPAARDGLGLWLNTMLPALLPFLILTGVLSQTGSIRLLMKPFAPLFSCFFGLSPEGGYALLLGLLCGYPMGARISSELYQSKSLTEKETLYLLSFACNASPAFLTGYLSIGCFEGKLPLYLLLLPLLLSDLICMLVFRMLLRPGASAKKTVSSSFSANLAKKETPNTLSPGAILDISIMNGFETITRLGGYLLLFSLLNAALTHFWPFSRNMLYLLSGAMELTTGLHSFSQSSLPLGQKYVYSMAMTAFGGICVMAQTRSCLDPALSMKTYLPAKLLNAVLTAGFALLFLQFIL